jgi:AcrR family transcriptional regulator
VAIETGLRQRKKQQTRQQIYEAAARLFGERGFDAVTVAQVAREADVSEVTVFNYYPTKEDLFFGGMEFFEERLLAAVRERPPGESALAAFRRVLLESSSRLAAKENAALIAGAAKLIGDSPALQAREREIAALYTQRLADLLAAESGSKAAGIEAYGVAGALMGVHRALVRHVRDAVLEGQTGPELAAAFRRLARRAFARLETGFATYAINRTRAH